MGTGASDPMNGLNLLNQEQTCKSNPDLLLKSLSANCSFCVFPYNVRTDGEWF